MIRNNVQSSQIASIGYDPATSTMEVEFHPTKPKAPHGKPGQSTVYQYSNVSLTVYQSVIAAPSVGSAFYKQIKGKYEYKKIA